MGLQWIFTFTGKGVEDTAFIGVADYLLGVLMCIQRPNPLGAVPYLGGLLPHAQKVAVCEELGVGDDDDADDVVMLNILRCQLTY